MSRESGSGGSPPPPHAVTPTDPFLTIGRWKWIILLGTLVCVMAACLVTWNAPHTYRIRAAITTGDLNEEYGKDLERLIAKLNPPSPQAASEVSPGSEPLTVEWKRPATIEVRAISQAPDGAVAAVRRTSGMLVDELNGWMDTQQAHYRAARRRAEELQVIVDRLRAAQAVALRQATSPSATLVLSSLSDALVEKETRLADLERALHLQGRRQARPGILVPPEVSRLSKRLRLATNLTISLAVGLAGSLAFAFAMEFTSRARRPDPPPP